MPRARDTYRQHKPKWQRKKLPVIAVSRHRPITWDDRTWLNKDQGTNGTKALRQCPV